MEVKTALPLNNAADGVPSLEAPSTAPTARKTDSLTPLQLTPLWEHVVRTRRLPSNIEPTRLFHEVAVRLADAEWQVRQHALRVLVDVIPAVANQGQLDLLIRPVVLPALVGNLGHAAPAVRKGALDTLRIYLTYSAEPEMALRTIINHGLEGPVSLGTRVPMGVILASPSLLHPLTTTGAITSSGLSHLVGALAKKLVLVSYQEPALHALVKIRDMVGEGRFQKCLDGFHLASKNDFDVLCQVYEVKSNLGDSGIDLQFVSSDVKQDQESGGYWSDDVQRASSSEGEEQRSPSDRSQYDDKVATGSDSSRDEVNMDQESPNAQAILDSEIKFNKETAITMTILEDDDHLLKDGIESSDNFTMKVLEDVEDNEEVRRTPRRVRFGGEMVMLRTPDSDPPPDDSEESSPKPILPPTPPIMNVDRQKHISKPSQIPLPIRPALGLPKIPNTKHELMNVPNGENNDSQNSSSDNEKHFDEAPGWDELEIIPEQVTEDIHNKEDWRARLRGIQGLMSCLDTPASTAVMGSSLPSLLHQLLVTLGEDRCPRVATAAVAAVRDLLPRLPHNALQKLLPQLVLGLTRHMSGTNNVPFKVEAARAVKELMQTCRPAPVVELLLSKHCIAAKSSKMRENALLVLTSALLTWPSTEFEPRLAATQIAHCVTDTRRRVRQAALECLAVLAQFTGPQYLLGEPMATASLRLKSPGQRQAVRSAVQARLARRQLPTLSEDGLVLYALQVPPPGHKSTNSKERNLSSGPDVDWILAGSGSLSSGSAKNRVVLSGISRSHESGSFTSSTSSKSVSRNPWSERRILEESSNFSREKSTSLIAIGVSALSSNDDPGTSFSPWPDESNKYTRVTSSAATQRAGRDSSSSSLSPPTNKVSLTNSSPISKPHFLEPLNFDQETYHKNSNNQIFRGRGRIKENSRRRRENKQQEWRFDHSGLQSHHIFNQQIAPYHAEQESSEFQKSNVPDYPRRFTPNPTFTSSKNEFETSSEQDQTSSAIKSNGINDHQSSVSAIPNLDHHPLSLEQILTPDQNDRPQIIPHDDSPPTPEDSFDDREIVNRKLQRRPNVSDNYFSKDFRETSNDTDEKEEIIQIIEVGNDLSPNQSTSSTSSLKTNSLSSLTKPEISTYHATTQTSIPAIKLDDDNVLLLSSRRRTLPTPSVLEMAEARIAQENKHEETLPQISYSDNTKSVSSHPIRGRSPPLRRNAKWSDEQPLALDPESNYEQTKEDNSPPPVNSTGIRRKINLGGSKKANKPSNKRETISTFSRQKSDKNAQMFPQTLPMKESEVRSSITQMLQGLKNDEDWEKVLNGMRLLVRLLRHHVQSLEPHYHTILLIVSEKTNDLRSQVARAASQVAVEFFRADRRLSESEVEILSSALLNRTSDTNRFLRSDANFALTTMTRSISPNRAAHAILQKGSSHRNQLVRAATARCLYLIVKKVGAYNILHKIPRTLRDRILSTSVSFLHEGFQETRHEAQEIFRLFVQISDFNECIRQALPSSKLKELRATLYRLRIL